MPRTHQEHEWLQTRTSVCTSTNAATQSFRQPRWGLGLGIRSRTGWHLSLRTLSEALRHRQGRWKYCEEIIRYRNPASDNGPQPSGGPAPLLAR